MSIFWNLQLNQEESALALFSKRRSGQEEFALLQELNQVEFVMKMKFSLEFFLKLLSDLEGFVLRLGLSQAGFALKQASV